MVAAGVFAGLFELVAATGCRAIRRVVPSANWMSAWSGAATSSEVVSLEGVASGIDAGMAVVAGSVMAVDWAVEVGWVTGVDRLAEVGIATDAGREYATVGAADKRVKLFVTASAVDGVGAEALPASSGSAPETGRADSVVSEGLTVLAWTGRNWLSWETGTGARDDRRTTSGAS